MEFYINSFPYDVNEFENYYYDAREILYENPRYDTTFFVANNTLIKEFGFEKLKNAELRLAILDRYYMGEKFTFPILQSRYPGYIDFLHLIAETEFEDAEFEAFCNKLDKRIESYGPLDTTDPFFTDSIDTRLSRAIDELADEEDDEEVALIVVQETINYLKSGKKIKTSFNREIENLIIRKAREANTEELAELVAMSFYMVYLSADYVKECLNDAYLVKGDITRQPVATTSIENIDASGSATIKGWIHENGGASVTERGIVWGTTYNPTNDDEVETSGNGLGEFSVTLSALSEGVTYFARTYATNEAGTAYGNLVRFTTADQVSSNEELENPVLSIYPNPVVNTLHFLNPFNEQSGAEFRIYNARGSLVFRKNLSGKQKEIVTIDISELENGFYSCVLTNGTRAAKESIVVAH
ncbi:MAG: T9SS type A sorting domain-containing protein [Prolixibacteraceae bacterium]|nr:T9SS type A sorting domain-containing protein [Prolixibacteraceae bacterium]